jgi:hypothetical protein
MEVHLQHLKRNNLMLAKGAGGDQAPGEVREELVETEGEGTGAAGLVEVIVASKVGVSLLN